MKLREYKTYRKGPCPSRLAGGLGAGILSVALCASLALPAVTGGATWNLSGAYASEYEQTIADAAAENSTDAETVAFTDNAEKSSTNVGANHVHSLIRVPTSENLASYASTTERARYYYVCRCGKRYKTTYAYGTTRAHNLATLKERYANSPKGGIAFTGSSLFSQWDSVAEDLQETYSYPANMVYNMAIGGMGADKWVLNKYVNAIAALEPSVVVVSGVNSLRYTSADDIRTVWEASDENVKLVERYIRELKERLPNVKILVVAGIKTVADYDSEISLAKTPTSWRRIDLYNAMLKNELADYDNVSYIDIQRFYMAEMKKGKKKEVLGFYCNAKKLRKTSSLEPARKIARVMYSHGVRLNPYFKRDLRHPTALSYSKVWVPKVGKRAVKLAREN